VPVVLNRSDRFDDLVPTALVVKGAAKQALDEGAPLAFPDPSIQLVHELILQAYV
jgi:hypothetical protein